MEVTKKIKLPIEKKGNKYYVKSLAALTMLMGASSVSGNYELYGVKKEGRYFVVDKKIVQERSKILTERIEDLYEKKDLIDQILNS